MRHIDRAIARRVQSYMDGVLASDDPRSRGHALSGPLAGYWRYRIGDHRLIALIEDRRLIVIAVAIGHRSDVYRDNE